MRFFTESRDMLYYLIFYGVDMLLWSAALVLSLAVIVLISGHRLSLAQKIWILILALYLAAVYNVAGAPELPYIYPNFNVNLIPFVDIRSDVCAYIINSGLNIILFIPLGFILPLLWSRFRSRKRIILTGFFFSLAIELSQLLNYRITDVDDLIMNSLGTWLGYELVMFLHRRSSKGLLLSSADSGRRQLIVVVLTVVLVMFALRPYITAWVAEIML